MYNRHVYYVAAVLALVAFAIFSYKVFLIGYPVSPGEPANAWDIETKIEFEAEGGPVKIISFLPPNRKGQRIFDYRFVAPGYGYSVESVDSNLQTVLATRKASGLQTVHVNFVVHRFRTVEIEHVGSAASPSKVSLEGASLAAARAISNLAYEQSSDEKTFVTALLKTMNGESLLDSVKQLAGRQRNVAKRIDAAVTILAMRNISSRRVNGIDLSGVRKDSAIVRWLETYIDGEWIAFDAQTGEPRIPESYLAWWYGRMPLVKAEGGVNLSLQLSFVRLDELLLERIIAQGKSQSDHLVTLSLFGLPLATQNVYRVLMVVPLGIFILVIIRNVIGLHSLGTFMPVLIALAFRETQLVWGVILFTTVVAAGLLFRAYVEHLKLLLVPRLASVLIFVVLFMSIMSVVTNQLGFQTGLSVALFPMVIMTMTIERISVIWDELGATAAIKQAFGSLAIAILCYLVMSQPLIEHLFFTFPELLLVLLAGTLLLGRYSGYRLLEIPRFKVLAGDGR